MKTGKWGKTILAALLAVMMILPSVAGIAEDAASFEKRIQVQDGVVKVYDPDSDAWVEDPELTESLKLNGDLSVLIEGEHQYSAALEMTAEGDDSSFEVTGSVAIDAKAEGEIYANDVYVHTDPGTSADVTVGGDVIAAGTSEEYTSMTGVYAESEGGEINVHVTGDVEVSSTGSLAESQGVFASASSDGEGGTSVVNVTVDGKVIVSTEIVGEESTAYETAVNVAAYGKQSETNITIGKGTEGQIILDNENGGTTSLTIREGGVTATDPHDTWHGDSGFLPAAAVGAANIEGTVDIDITGDISMKNGEVALASSNDSGDTTIKVTGDIVSSGDGIIILSSTYSNNDETNADTENKTSKAMTNVTINGVVNVAGESDNAVKGVDAAVYGDNADVAFSVSGITVTNKQSDKAEEKEERSSAATGIYIVTSDKSTVTGEVNGPVTVEAEEDEATGIHAIIEDGAGEIEVVVHGQVSASGEASTGIYAETWSYENEDSAKESGSVSIVVTEGGVTAEGKEDITDGIFTDNWDGDISVDVTGDVVSSGYGIRMFDEADFRYESVDPETITHSDEAECVDEKNQTWKTVIDGQVVYYHYNDEDGVYDAEVMIPIEREGGESTVTVKGDVIADLTAVNLTLTEEKSAMEVTVDGTVEGKEHAIVISKDTIAKNLTMTVWEVKPNEDGNIVERCETEHHEDAEGEDQFTETYTADKEAEKLIQYIIKIEDNSRDYIATNGTTDFTAGNGEKYQVAHEGDKVLVKLNIPEGKELVGAYWDKAQSEAGRLLKDAEGNYYLEVPRGGGVMLSVTLKDAPKPEPQPAPIPVPDPATKRYSVVEPIVTARDLSGMVTISFYASRNYVVTLEDGSKERGTFEQINGEIVLQSGDREITIANDGTFTYICQIDVNRTYHFVLSQTDLDALLAVK